MFQLTLPGENIGPFIFYARRSCVGLACNESPLH